MNKLTYILFFIAWALLLSYPQLIKQSLAASEQAGQTVSNSQNEQFVVSGIFFDEESPRVLINEELFSLNANCCGGKIIGIFNDFIVMQFPYGRREYRLGDVIRKDKVKTRGSKIIPGQAPVVPTSYVKKMNSFVENFIASHKRLYDALDIHLFTDPDQGARIRARAEQILEVIRKKKATLTRLSAPDSCKRHYALTVKLLDSAEDGWRAVSAGDKNRAEVFFARLLRIAQEISRESVSILARQ